MNISRLSLRSSSGLNRLIVLLLFCLIPLSTVSADDWKFSGVGRIVAVSDIHGAYDAVVATFQRAGVLDDNLDWVGGETHLVITGDLLDRGPDSRKVIDLIMRLEQESVRTGGQVHQLLGNHEVMNLIGDVRYVSDAEYAAFTHDESAQEREYWFQQFRRLQPTGIDEGTIRAGFDQKAPPGYFGYRRAFRKDGIYGKWLLEKPLMIVINDTAFVHGGAPPYVAEHGLAGINGALKTDLLNYVTALSALEDASVLNPIYRFRDAPAILEEKLEQGQLDSEQATAAQAMLKLRKSPLHNATGPLWYRGTALCNPLMEADVLNAALTRVGATRIVFGHTPTSTRKVQQWRNGHAVEIDTGMLRANYNGSGNALVIEEDSVSVANQDTANTLMPITHPRGVGTDAEMIDDDTLTSILTNGAIISAETEELAWRLVQVAAFDKTVFAYFRPLPSETGFIPEIAAYRLDRLLGLYMVPVTVRREISGQDGTLQYIPLSTLNEHERVTSGKGQQAVCSMSKQAGAMLVFDTLINNPTRTPLSMLYGPEDFQLMLVDHSNAFATVADRPAYLGSATVSVGEEWRSALREIDDQVLDKNLADVLDKRRLMGLGSRRDNLLRDSTH